MYEIFLTDSAYFACTECKSALTTIEHIRAIGVKTYWNAMEIAHQRGKPSIEAAAKIADLLNVSLDWLVGHTDLELDKKMIERI